MAVPEFNAGKVYVEVLPSLEGWRQRVQSQLDKQLRGLKPTVTITPVIDSSRFTAKIVSMRRQLDSLQGRAARAGVDVDTRDSDAKLARTRAGLASLDGRQANIRVDDGGSIEILHTRIQRLIAASIAASGAIGGLGAGVIALGAGAVVGGAGLLALVSGATNVASAMKAQEAATKQAGQTAAQEGAQQVVAANQVAGAREALANAQRSASSTVRTALVEQARAEQRLQAAQVSALRAQQALTDARREASRSIEDLKNQAISDSLAQRDATLDLQEAQEELNQVMADPSATQRQREEAQLTFDQAKQRLAEVSLSYQRSTVDAAEAAKAGVEGSREVISAQDSLVASQRAVQDAQTSAGEAARRVDEARLDGAQQLAQAQRQLESATARAGVQATQQGEAQTKALEAMEKLSPEAYRLSVFLKAQSGEWTELQKASQQFAPGLQRGLEQLTPFWGQIQGNVATLSESMGSFFEVVIGKGLANAGPFFDIVASASTELFPRFGETVNTAADAVGELFLEMLPVVPVALDTVDAISALVSAWAPFIASASGPLLEALQNLIRDAQILGPVLEAVATPAADLTTALSAGLREALAGLISDGHLRNFLDAVIDLVDTVSPLIGSAGQLAGVVGQALVPALRLTNLVLTPLVGAVNLLVDLIDALPQPVFDIIAAFVAFRLAAGPIEGLLRGIGNHVGTAATGVGLLGLRMGVADGAASRFATAGSRVGTVISSMGKAVPVAGIALIGLVSAFEQLEEAQRKTQERADELARAMIRGGSAADTVRPQLDNTRKSVGEFSRNVGVAGGVFKKFGIDVTGGLGDLAQKTEESYQKQRDSMTSVELAQERVRQAQVDYDRALRDFGPTSAITKYYHEALTLSTDGLDQAQRDAADSTKTFTERLQDQQDQILGMVDAETGKARADVRLREAQDRYNKSVREHGRNSNEAKIAQLDLTEAQSRYVVASANAAVATAKAGGAMDTTAAKTKGTNDSLINLLRTQGESLPPAILSMIAHMTAADQKFYGLGVTVDNTGRTILTLPGTATGPPVSITFTDNIPQVQANVEALRVKIEDFFFWMNGPAPELAPGSLGGLLGVYPGGALMPTPPGRATGGFVPGRGNTDSVPAMLMPGEYVFSKPAVTKLGVGYLSHLHMAARYAEGGLVRPLRMADGGVVPTPASNPASLSTPLTGLPPLFDDITASVAPLVAALVGQLAPALQQVLAATTQLSAQGQAFWRALTGAVAASTGAITGSYLAALRAGLSTTNAAVALTSSTFGTQFAAIQGYAANPVRWALTYPFNAGLVAAWNRLNTDFALGKPIAPIPIPFAVGGQVPGKGDKDSVRAYLTPGEYVLSKPAIENLGGVAAVDRLHQMARAGLIGPDAGLGKVGDAARRLRLMQVIPLDGLGFAYGGVQPHVAMAGTEIERVFGALPGGIGGVGSRPNASDHPSGHALDFMTMTNQGLGDRIASYLQANSLRLLVKYLIWRQQFNDGSGWSLMEDRGSVTANHFDHVHASFLPGGAGGRPFSGVGGFFNPAELVGSYFADTYRLLGQLTTLFAGVVARQSAGVGTQATDRVKQAAIDALSGLTAGSAVAGSPEVMSAVRAVAATFGWGDGPQWNALSWLIGRESSWNPAAANPTSSARGLFQKMVSIHGPIEPTITGQAQWGLGYIRGRYGDPLGAQRFHQRNNWYDQGGYLPPGLSLAYNGTGRAERVLSPQQERMLVAGQGGGEFNGALYLDSGAFLGSVRGEIRRASDATGRAIARRTR